MPSGHTFIINNHLNDSSHRGNAKRCDSIKSKEKHFFQRIFRYSSNPLFGIIINFSGWKFYKRNNIPKK